MARTGSPFAGERLRHLRRSYELWLRASGYKPDTVSRALQILDQYIAYCSANNLNGALKESIEDYLANASRRVRPHTLLNYWKDLRLAFKWGESTGLVARNPVDQIPRPKPSLYERERDVRYTEDDLRKLLSVVPHWTWLGLRDRAIILTLWGTGMRASELCNLTMESLDWEEGEIAVVAGKGGVNYSCLLNEECESAIRKYLLQHPHESEHLFVDRRGGMLSRHALEQMLRKLGRRAGWKENCFPHGFRHTFRIRMREMGLDDTDIAALLGHKTVRSTWAYSRREAAATAKERLRMIMRNGHAA